MITTWYLQSHRTWDGFCHSCIGSPSCPRGPSRRGSLCRFAIRCTPDRSKLVGSHGQRPWLQDVVIGISLIAPRRVLWRPRDLLATHLATQLDGPHEIR